MFTLSTVLLATTTFAAPNARVPRAGCSAYDNKEKCLDEAPETAECVWGPTMPGDWDEALYVCQDKSCETLGYVSGDPQEECKMMSGCTFHEEIQFCSTTGKNPPCELYYSDGENEKCPAYCDYSEPAQKCIEKGSKAPCDLIYDEADCTTAGCMYLSDIYKCWEKGAKVPCSEYEYAEQDLCPEYCSWVPTSSAAGSDGKCLKEGEIPACEEFNFSPDGEMCPSSRCTYYEAENLCISKDKDVPCNKIWQGQDCAPLGRCAWYPEPSAPGIPNGGYGTCDDCPSKSNNCVTKYDGPTERPTPGPDTGAACNSYYGDTVYDCPEPRCFLDFDGAGGGGGGCGGGGDGKGECRNPACDDLMYEDVECAAQKQCSYDDDSGICRDTSQPFPCHDLHFQGECDAQPADCQWINGKSGEADSFCIEKGGSPTCDQYRDEDSCPTTCQWNEFSYSCLDPTYKPKCEEYSTEGDCPPSDGCAWTNGICWEEGRPLPCNAFCTAFECDSSGECVFDQGDFMCKPCDGGTCKKIGACSTYTTEETCPESACVFEFDDPDQMGGNSAGVCKDKTCSTIDEAQECKAHGGCKWDQIDSEGGTCTLAGYSTPCTKIWEEQECVDAGCAYSHEQCVEKNTSPGCSKFMPAECGTGDASDCEVSKDGRTCQIKKSSEPNTPPPLPGKGDGKGNEDEKQCTIADYDQVKGKLEEAEEECVVVGRKRRGDRARRAGATDEQLECLAYFLAQTPNPTTVAKACPCLWLYGNEISPWDDHWMEVKC